MKVGERFRSGIGLHSSCAKAARYPVPAKAYDAGSTVSRPCKKRKDGAPTVSKRERRPEGLGHPSTCREALRVHSLVPAGVRVAYAVATYTIRYFDHNEEFLPTSDLAYLPHIKGVGWTAKWLARLLEIGSF
jgi:hypothetical protein